MKKRVLSLLLVLVMLVGLLPTVALAAEETGDLFQEFQIRAGKTVLYDGGRWGGTPVGDFAEDKYEYNLEVVTNSDGDGTHDMRIIPQSNTAVVTAKLGDGEEFSVGTDWTDIPDMVYSDNDLTVKYTDGDTVLTCLVHIRMIPRVEMSYWKDSIGATYWYYSADVKDDDHIVYRTSSEILDDYWIFVPENRTELTLSSYSANEGHTTTFNSVAYEGNKDVTIPIAGLDEVKVHTVGDDGKYSTDYTIHIHWQDVVEQRFEIPEGTSLRVQDTYRKAQQKKDGEPTTFVGLLEGETYSYAVTKDGYVSVSGSFTAAKDAEVIKIEPLETVPANTHTQYTGEWTNFRGSDDNMAIRNAKTPQNTEQVELKWAVKMGTSMWSSPTPPIILNDVDVDGETHDVLICAMTRKIYLLDKETGAVLKSASMNGSAGFATNPLTYAEGLVFVQLDNQIQAFDAATLESVWLSERIGGQTISPVTYHDGHIYIGTWNGEKSDGTFACFSVADEKPDVANETKYATWTLTHKGGFYWAGAYVTDNYAVFGSDDGTSEGDYTANAVLYSVNTLTGEIIDTIEGIQGNIRSTVAYYDGACYAVTKGGLFLKAPISEDGHFDHDGFKTVSMGNMCTSTPTIYNGKAFIGTSGASQFYSPGVLNVIDVSTMEIVKNITLPGYPQAPMLMSTGYVEDTGIVYIYTTYNAPPGGMYCVSWNTNDDTYGVEHIFVPSSSMRQYCLGSPICDAEGTIYYKNDSGYLFALKRTTLSVTGITVDDMMVSGFDANKHEYTQTVYTNAVTVAADASEGANVEIVANGQTYGNHAALTLTDADTVVTLNLSNEIESKSYTLTLHKASNSTSLEKVYVNHKQDSYEELYSLTPAYSSDVDTYYLYDVPAGSNGLTDLYLHVLSSQPNMNNFVYYAITKQDGWPVGQCLSGGMHQDHVNYTFRIVNKNEVQHSAVYVNLTSEDGSASRFFRFISTHMSKEDFENEGKVLGLYINGQFGIVDEENHTVTVNAVIPSNEMDQWDITALAPELTIAGVSVSPASNTAQDFTKPVTYTVTKADGTTVDWTVSISLTEGPSSDASIQSVAYMGTVGKYKGKTRMYGDLYDYVEVTLPYGTPLPTEDNAVPADFTVVTNDAAASYDSNGSYFDDSVSSASKSVWWLGVESADGDYVNTIAAFVNGPCKDISMSVTGPEEAIVNQDDVTFTVSGSNMIGLATATLTMEISEEYLTNPVVETVNGWYVIAQSYQNGILTVVAGNNAGVNGEGDILHVTCKNTGKAVPATLTVTSAVLSVYQEEEGEEFVRAILDNATATTQVTYSIYDVNRDGVVNQLDVTRAQRFYGTDNAVCDVNGDGEVNIADLILILNHYTAA